MRQIRNFIYIRFHRSLVLSSMSGQEQKTKGVKTFLLNLYLQFFPTPSPHKTKMETLLKYGGRGVWVETGTYLGETAEILAKAVSEVHTIEPSDKLFEVARKRLSGFSNVIQYKGSSEEKLSGVLSILRLNGCAEVNFWLDGHYSAGDTFKGLDETPIHHELSTIREFMHEFCTVNIFIDDVRCFQPTTDEYRGYPSLKSLIQWSNEQSLKHMLIHDILLITKHR